MKTNEKDKNITILGKETVFNGNLKFRDVLHIEGVFNGTIDATGELYIGKNATCKVEYIKALSIFVEGSVFGPMFATCDVELKSCSHVEGDIEAKRLKIADNVLFDGAIHMASNEKALHDDVFALDASQFKAEVERTEDEDISNDHDADMA